MAINTYFVRIMYSVVAMKPSYFRGSWFFFCRQKIMSGLIILWMNVKMVFDMYANSDNKNKTNYIGCRREGGWQKQRSKNTPKLRGKWHIYKQFFYAHQNIFQMFCFVICGRGLGKTFFMYLMRNIFALSH